MYVCPECGTSRAQDGTCPADGVPLAARGADQLLGTSIGPHRLARVLGDGANGRVYLGVNEAIGNRVAIKVLSPRAAGDPGTVERFFREASSVNVIRHEAVINTLDLSRLDDGRPYIVMEYLDGAPLSAHFAGDSLPIATVTSVFGQVLDGLDAAHRRGVIHRDLKPDNVYVTAAGRAKILDFGIAKLTELALSGVATTTGAFLGTPHYVSPEQAVNASEVDARSDLYAVGVMLYEALTGQRPFAGDNLYALLRQHVEATPPSVRALRPDVPDALEDVVARAMAKAPDDRFATAADMAVALAHATAAPEPAPPPSTITGDGGAQAATKPTEPVVLASHAPARSNWGRWSVVVAAAGAAAAAAIVGLRSDRASPSRASALAVDAGRDRVALPVAPDDAGEPPARAAAPPRTAQDAHADASGGSDANRRRARRAQPTRPLAAPPATGGPSPRIDKPAQATPGVRVETDGTGETLVIGRPFNPGNGKDFAFEPDYDPRAFDAVRYRGRAQELARRVFPDAVMIGLEVRGARQTGLVDLAGSKQFEAAYRFRSPANSKSPADLPLGVELEGVCLVYVDVTATGMRVYPNESFYSCRERRLRGPACGLAHVWTRARAMGAPGGNAVAHIELLADGWYFQLGDLSETIPDDC